MAQGSGVRTPHHVKGYAEPPSAKQTQWRCNVQTSCCPLLCRLPGWRSQPQLLLLGQSLFKTAVPYPYRPTRGEMTARWIISMVKAARRFGVGRRSEARCHGRVERSHRPEPARPVDRRVGAAIQSRRTGGPRPAIERVADEGVVTAVGAPRASTEPDRGPRDCFARTVACASHAPVPQLDRAGPSKPGLGVIRNTCNVACFRRVTIQDRCSLDGTSRPSLDRESRECVVTAS